MTTQPPRVNNSKNKIKNSKRKDLKLIEKIKNPRETDKGEVSPTDLVGRLFPRQLFILNNVFINYL